VETLVKDPLQADDTPFEVLAVGPDASPAEVEAAFKRALSKGGSSARAMDARRTLHNPAKRELVRIFHYDARVAMQLDPSPLDAASLAVDSRGSTASAWERTLARSFPDLEIAHSLAVLWYWSAVRGKPLPNGGPDLTVPTLWRWAIAYWAMLATSEALQPAVRKLVMDRLANDLNRTAEKLDAIDRPEARRCRALQDTLTVELESARTVAEAHVTLAHARVFGGKLLLEHLGVLEPVRAMGGPIQTVLGPHAENEALLAAGKPEAALAALARLPARERHTTEADDLAARAHTLRGTQHASVSAFEDALVSFQLALNSGKSPDVRASTRREITTACLSHAATLREQNRNEAIKILDTCLKLTDDSESLQLVLAEDLCERGIERMNDAQAGYNPQQGDLPRFRKALKRGLKDLERAVKLGSQKAKDQMPLAKKIVEQAASAPDPEVARRLAGAAEHAAQRNWDAAITALEELLETAGSGPGAMRDELRRSLAVSHHNRAMQLVNRTMELPGDRDVVLSALGSARRDLQSAAELDPIDSDYTDALAHVDQLIGAANTGSNLATTANGMPAKRKPRVVSAAVLLLICCAVGAAIDQNKGVGSGFAVWCVIMAVRWTN
jgi:tetratricopeptide (TPR) repeat protein